MLYLLESAGETWSVEVSPITLLSHAHFRLQDEEACGCDWRVWVRAPDIWGSPPAADHSAPAAHHHCYHWLDWQQNGRWVNVTIGIAGWIDSKKCQVGEHHHCSQWLNQQQNARWVIVTIGIAGWIDSKKCQVGEYHHCSQWPNQQQNARWVNIAIAKCQVGVHHHHHHWLDRQQNARWVNITITGWIDSKMPGGCTSPSPSLAG